MSNGNPGQLVPQELLSRLFQRKVVPFLGAGCSVPAPSRLPTANELAQSLVERGAGSGGQALEDIAEQAWAQGGWAGFAQLLPIDEWRSRPPNLVTRVISELCRERLIGQILTTNWDLLIESALNQIGQPYRKVIDAQSLAVEPVGTVTVIKLNGCIDHPEFIKATRTQIEAEGWLEAWIDAVFEVLVRTNSLLFAGYSGASRAATTTIAAIVAVAERQANDFIVDRQTPEAISASSESGRAFIEATTLVPFTGDSCEFFGELRESVFPLLLAQPARSAQAMATEVVAPTAVTADELGGELDAVVAAVTATNTESCQRWLATCFRTYPDYDHVDPYLPLIPNETEIGKCLLLLAVARWTGRLGLPASLTFSVAGTAAGVDTEAPFYLVVCPSTQRLDAAARAAVVALARESASSRSGVGVALGGLGDVEAVTTSFSVARGTQLRSAARGGGPAIGWINADALFAAFAADSDADTIKGRIRVHLDQAMTRALEAAA
jgi:SIR2-like domain